MANRLKGLATGVTSWFKKPWLKKPWQFTGPVSGAEYLEAVPNATKYRVNAPATQPQRAIVPHAEPEHVFDIKYYLRDRRREPSKITTIEVSSAEGFVGSAPAASKWYVMGKEFPITDEPGDGYQK